MQAEMSTSTDHVPPFPTDVPTADIPRLDFGKIEQGDSTEAKRLFDACRNIGFFLLDLQRSDLGRGLLSDADGVFKINKAVFGMSDEEKAKFAFTPDGINVGYKAHGASKVDSNGTPDRHEMWNVSQDEVFGLAPERKHEPEAIISGKPTFKSFMTHAHSITQTLFNSLDKALELPIGTLGARHRSSESSMSICRLLKYAPQPEGDRRTAMLAHTDIGSISMLFNQLGGLQILPPQHQQNGSEVKAESGGDSWQYVKPEPGCAICNVGDALVAWTAGALRSNLHRVTYAPGEQATVPRHTVCYFARPEKETKMARLNEGIIAQIEDDETLAGDADVTAVEWYRKKSTAILSGRDPMRSRGGSEFVSLRGG